MLDLFNNGIFESWDLDPGLQVHIGYGYDPEAYISTAQIAPAAYTSQVLIQARLGGLIKLIEACDDSVPPIGDLTGDALTTYNNVIQNVTTEINGYLSSVYPIPLVQTGTVAILQVTGLSTDGNNSVTSLKVIAGGNYAVAPNTAQSPVYLRYLDPLANSYYFGQNWQNCQQGTGLELTLTYEQNTISDESGQQLPAYSIDTVTIDDGGTKYYCGQLLVLIGGQSFVPAKIREAALCLICHDLYQRRLAPEEKNMFSLNNKIWRGTADEDGMLKKIGNQDMPLDGTYKRFYSSGQSWNSRSVLFDANSL